MEDKGQQSGVFAQVKLCQPGLHSDECTGGNRLEKGLRRGRFKESPPAFMSRPWCGSVSVQPCSLSWQTHCWSGQPCFLSRPLWWLKNGPVCVPACATVKPACSGGGPWVGGCRLSSTSLDSLPLIYKWISTDQRVKEEFILPALYLIQAACISIVWEWFGTTTQQENCFEEGAKEGY